MIFFEEKSLKVLGGKIDNQEVVSFMRDIKEAPNIDDSVLGFPDDSKDYYFLKSGIVLMFRKSNDLLIAISVYFIP